MVFRAERAIWSNIVKTHAYIREMHKFEKHNPSLPGVVYKSGTGTSGRVCGDWDLGTRDEGLEDYQVWDAGTCGTGTGEVENWDAGDAGCE